MYRLGLALPTVQRCGLRRLPRERLVEHPRRGRRRIAVREVVRLELVDPGLPEQLLVVQRVAGERRGITREDLQDRVGDDPRVTPVVLRAEPEVPCRPGVDGGDRPERVTPHVVGREFVGQRQREEAHPEFGPRVRRLPGCAVGRHRRRVRQQPRTVPFAEVWEERPRDQVAPPGVHVVEQVEPFRREVRDVRQLDGAGVVDDDVDLAEPFDGGVDGRLDGVSVAYVQLDGQALDPTVSAGVGRLVYCPLQLGVGVVDRLPGRDDVRTRLRERECDLLADTTGRAGDERRRPREIRRVEAVESGCLHARPSSPTSINRPTGPRETKLLEHAARA